MRARHLLGTISMGAGLLVPLVGVPSTAAAASPTPVTSPTSTPAQVVVNANQCDAVLAKVGPALKNGSLPLLPKELFGGEVDGLAGSRCAPAFWNRTVFALYMLRIINLLNWIASAMAIMVTVYAGVLYIGSYANEGNVKKAKGLLITTYTGLVLVFLARVILFGSISLVKGGPVTAPQELEGTTQVGR